MNHRPYWGPWTRRTRFQQGVTQYSDEANIAALDPGADELERRVLALAESAARGAVTAEAVKTDTGISIRAVTFDELRGFGLSMTQARRVIRLRDEGGLGAAADLDSVPGIPRDQLARLKTLLRD